MNCILIDAPGPGETITLDARASGHVLSVLKKKTGDTLLAGIIHGPIGLATIVDVIDGHVIITRPTGETPPVPNVEVILAMPRPKVMKRLWSPLASLGIERITIIGGERVEPYYFDSHAVSADVYRPRLIEGLEQVRDTHVPEVFIEPSFDRFAAAFLPTWPESVRLLAEPAGSARIRDVLQPGARVTLAIGPEGGWTKKEMTAWNEHGFIPVGLGPRSLRTDTAAIALLALVAENVR